MSFEDEWAQHKNSVSERQSTQTQLNQVASEGGGPPPLLGNGNPDLAAAPEKKKAAANTIENTIEPGTKSAADAADEPTRVAIKEFDTWETGAGLKKTHKHWDDQVKRLMGRLDSEKKNLRTTSTWFTNNDIDTGSNFGPLKSKVTGL